MLGMKSLLEKTPRKFLFLLSYSLPSNTFHRPLRTICSNFVAFEFKIKEIRTTSLFNFLSLSEHAKALVNIQVGFSCWILNHAMKSTTMVLAN